MLYISTGFALQYNPDSVEFVCLRPIMKGHKVNLQQIFKVTIFCPFCNKEHFIFLWMGFCIIISVGPIH